MIPAWLKARLDLIFGIDLRSLALFRVMLGCVLFVDQCWRLTDLGAFYTDAGVMPRDWLVTVNGLWRLTLHSANGELWFAATLFAVEMTAALMIVLGWRTRSALLVAFVLNASLLNRNQMVLLGGDILLTMLLFWAMFVPVAARASIDAALSNMPPPENNLHRSWGSAGLLLQVMSVYFFSAILKSGADWHNGTAVDYALAIEGYASPIGQWLRTFPALTTPLTYYVYWLELLGPIVVFTPVFSRAIRFVVTLMLMVMHIGFLFCLELGPFPYVSLTSLTVLAGGWLWDLAAAADQKRALKRGPHSLRIYYDCDCGFCLKSVLILRQLLLLPRAEIGPAQDLPRAKALLEANYSWVIIDHDDRAHLKWPAFVILLRRSPIFAPIGWLLSGAWAVPPGNAVYDFVGRHRGGFGKLTGVLLPFREIRLDPGRYGLTALGLFFALYLAARAAESLFPGWLIAVMACIFIAAGLCGTLILWSRRPLWLHHLGSALSGFLVIVFLLWNLCSINWLPQRLYAWLTPPARILRVDQYWNMFAPFPSREDGWFVIPAQLKDGTELDLLHPDRGPVSYDKPRYITHEWKNIRWHKYLERIWSTEFADNRLYYGRYLCRSWNAEHRGDQQLDSFKIIYMLEKSVPHGETPKVEQIVLWRHGCFVAPAPDTPPK